MPEPVPGPFPANHPAWRTGGIPSAIRARDHRRPRHRHHHSRRWRSTASSTHFSPGLHCALGPPFRSV